MLNDRSSYNSDVAKEEKSNKFDTNPETSSKKIILKLTLLSRI